MSSWQRPRSPSPPYRSRRYSPSREVSPPPPTTHSSLPPPPAQRYDPQGPFTRDDLTTRPMRSEHYSPPSVDRAPLPARPTASYSGASVDHYVPPPGRRSRSPSPRYRGRRSPSPRRYRETRPYSPPSADRYRSSPPPAASGRRNRPGAADFYDDPPRERATYDGRPGPALGRSMVADREEERVREIPPPRLPKVEEQWERGLEPPSQQVCPRHVSSKSSV